jgi:glycosyltransferase involved in cell wall biosynthesis
MKVLHLTNDFLDEIGGVSQHVTNLTKHLVKHAEVVIAYLSLAGRSDTYLDEHGRTIYCLPHQGNAARRYVQFPMQGIRRIVGIERPDIVHVHSPLEAARIGHTNTIRIYTTHWSQLFNLCGNPIFRNFISPWFFKKFEAVICPSHASFQRTAHPHKVVIPNGVDIERFQLRRNTNDERANFLQRSYGITYSHQVIILTTRRLVPDKQILGFVAANADFFMRNAHKVMLLIAGDGPEFLPITQLVKKRKLHNIHLLGAIPHTEIDGLYYASDYCVIPSKYEVFGISALEAMATGSVVIASPSGGLAEIFTPGVTGLSLMKNLRLDESVDIFDAAEAERVRAQAHARVVEQYSWNAISEKTYAMYTQVQRTFSGNGQNA